ncbi:MAG: N-acetylmuramoyl-L-alanine amidase family protein [Romboutsia sp.]|uniref:N-acetylmuramoyl-L-alanine amidase family protein n=1 Tax=Romboutsia sp. TaxID=1965302 RepID=UPI003F3FD2EB
MATRKKTTNNPQRKKVKIKRRKKVNKLKLILLFCIMAVSIFGISKTVVGVTTIAKNIETKKQEEIEKQKALEAQKQFNLEVEQEQGLDKKYTIVLDPGHGGKDPGNPGYSTRQKGSTVKIYEKDICLDVSKKVASILSKQNDVQVVLTRTEDKYIELEDRANLANTQKADALVSIHMNAEAGGDTAYGIETYYRSGSTDKSQNFADTVQSTIGSYISMRDRGVKDSIFQVLMNSDVPSILVECGFISNYKEEQKLLDEKYQSQLAEGIAQGILTFLDENNK